jgi:hypothetical protein
VAIRKYEREKNLASFYFLATCRNLGQNLAIFFGIEIWREKNPKTVNFSPI